MGFLAKILSEVREEFGDDFVAPFYRSAEKVAFDGADPLATDLDVLDSYTDSQAIFLGRLLLASLNEHVMETFGVRT